MDIRSVLKKVSLPDLKNIVRKHNKHFNIKIGQRKEDLIDAIANVYKELSGSFLIPKEFKLRLTELAKKGVIKKKAIQQAPPTPAPRAAPLPVFIKATPALKEKVRKYKEARKKREEPEPEPVPTKAEKGLASLVKKKIIEDSENSIFDEFKDLLKKIKENNNKIMNGHLIQINNLIGKIINKIRIELKKNEPYYINLGFNKTRKELENIASNIDLENDDLFDILDFIKDKLMNNISQKLDKTDTSYGILGNFAGTEINKIRNRLADRNTIIARIIEEFITGDKRNNEYFNDSIERLKEKPFKTKIKGGYNETILSNKTFVLDSLEKAKTLIKKYGNYPYLQEYIDKFNEAMKTSIFARRIKQAQKE